MDVAALISSATAALGFAKELIEVDRAVDQAQWKLKLAELTSALADLKVGALELKSEIDARDKEIVRLRDAFKFRGQTIKKHDQIYEMWEGRPVGMPFCPRCLAEDGFHMKLTSLAQPGRPTQCPRCKSMYGRPTEYLAAGEH